MIANGVDVRKTRKDGKSSLYLACEYAEQLLTQSSRVFITVM